MINYSTGAVNKLLGTSPLKDIFNDSIIQFYTGAQPISADSAVTGTLLGTVTVSGAAFTPGSPTAGLAFDAPSGKTLSKAAAEVWQFKGIAAGTIGYFRLLGNAVDAGATSTSLPRIDGTIGITTGDMKLSTVTSTVGATITIDTFVISAS